MTVSYMKNLAFIILATFIFSTGIVLAEENNIQAQKKLHLGAIVPLTGPLAFFGNDFIKAFELAKEDYPEINQLIEIEWEDSAYDTKQAVSAFNKLVSVKQTDVVLSFGGPMLHALAPLAEQRKIPFFATESEKSDCQGRPFCSLFRNEEDEWGQATWQILRKSGKKKIGIVKNQNQFMNTFVNAIVNNKKEDETVNILLDVPPEIVDLRTDVLSLRSKEVDALGVYLLPGSHHGLLSALRNNNQTFPMIFGVEEFLVKENNKGFESIVNNALVIAPSSTEEYREKFQSRFGYSAGFYYTPAFYDFLVLLKDVIRSNKNLRGSDLVKAMRFDGKRTGVSGSYSVKVSKDGVYSYSFPIAVYRVNDNNVSVDEIINF